MAQKNGFRLKTVSESELRTRYEQLLVDGKLQMGIHKAAKLIGTTAKRLLKVFEGNLPGRLLARCKLNDQELLKAAIDLLEGDSTYNLARLAVKLGTSRKRLKQLLVRDGQGHVASFANVIRSISGTINLEKNDYFRPLILNRAIDILLDHKNRVLPFSAPLLTASDIKIHCEICKREEFHESKPEQVLSPQFVYNENFGSLREQRVVCCNCQAYTVNHTGALVKSPYTIMYKNYNPGEEIDYTNVNVLQVEDLDFPYRNKYRRRRETQYSGKHFPRYRRNFILANVDESTNKTIVADLIIFNKRRPMCACCNSRTWGIFPIGPILTIGHINGNKQDFDKDNLQTICPNCKKGQDDNLSIPTRMENGYYEVPEIVLAENFD